MTAAQPHISVLLAEVIAALDPRDGEIHVDGTFGAGGYSRALLQAAKCRVIGIDRDPSAIARGNDMARDWDGRLTVVQGCYGDMDQALQTLGISQVNGIALDIGVSSMQIDQAERGFSFAKDGPLDMRMGTDGGATAADLVNSASEEQLADIIFHYGEERHARRVARAITTHRKLTPYSRTGELAETIRSSVPRSKDGIDPATRTFQALRIAVNDELGELERGLMAAEKVLAPGGRLAVVTFHSLEDRIVKEFLKSRSNALAQPSRHIPVAAGPDQSPVFTPATRKPISASADEIARNPRSRSARLRSALRTSAPARINAPSFSSRPFSEGIRP